MFWKELRLEQETRLNRGLGGGWAAQEEEKREERHCVCVFWKTKRKLWKGACLGVEQGGEGRE